jgi:hypothetical protein
VGGRPQLIYELHLTNLSWDTLQLQTVRVCSKKSPESFLLLAGTSLDEKLQPARMEMGPSLGSTARNISPGARTILYLEMESLRGYNGPHPS